MHVREPGEAPGKPSTNVFLAYASEDVDVAAAAKDAMEDYAERKKDIKICVMPWSLSPEAGKSILENLLSKMSECPFGVFLLTPVDEKKSRDVKSLIARDNVVFEAGLFIGMRGPEQTFMLLPDKYQVEPSDLQGIIGIRYDYDKVADAGTSNNRQWGIRQACDNIVDSIQKVMSQPQYSASQPPPGTGLGSAGTAQPGTPIDLLGVALVAEAAENKLLGLQEEDLIRGRLVVHALYGVGQVMAFDPPGQRPCYVTVRFGTSTGVFDIAELFVNAKRV